jgi:hypothetical protein
MPGNRVQSFCLFDQPVSLGLAFKLALVFFNQEM